MFQSLRGVTYQVTDLKAVKNWYEKVLGIKAAFSTDKFLFFLINGNSLFFMPKESVINTEQTIVYWTVDNVIDASKVFIENGAEKVSEMTNAGSVRNIILKDPFGNIFGISDQIIQEGKSVENAPSETAMRVAFNRALASKSTNEIKGSDYIAEFFVSDENKEILKSSEEVDKYIDNNHMTQLYGFMISRTKFIDNIFYNALAENIPQIVFLGAGYDSRAIRFSDKIKDTKIFELDAAPTQNRKRSILEQEKINLPENLKFIQINFLKETIEDVLTQAGYDKDKKTLFIWEGVTYYLTSSAVIDTFKFVKNNTADGTSICFDYLKMEIPSINTGEPFRFWIGHEKMDDFLKEKGFKIIEHLDVEEVEKRYLTNSKNELVYHSLSFFSFVHALVN